MSYTASQVVAAWIIAIGGFAGCLQIAGQFQGIWHPVALAACILAGMFAIVIVARAFNDSGHLRGR